MTATTANAAIKFYAIILYFMQNNHQLRPRALDSFNFIDCFLSRDERAPAALYDEVVGAPIALGCLRT